MDTDLDFDKECVYDKESMVTLVSPTITLSFVNDKAWDELEQVYQFDYKPIMLSNGNRTVSLHAREEARRAMDIWYRTFASYAPWTTLLRMLTRSPLNALDKLQNRVWDDDGEDNASYVENLYHEMMRSLVRLPKAIHDELLNDRNRVFLESLLTASKRNVEDIRREVFISGTTVKSQYLNYSFVGELYKKAFDRARLCGYRKPLDEKIIRQMRVKDPKRKVASTTTWHWPTRCSGLSRLRRSRRTPLMPRNVPTSSIIIVARSCSVTRSTRLMASSSMMRSLGWSLPWVK